MENEALFQQIKNKNQEAFKEWTHRHGEQIARMAFQYGKTVNDASEIAALTMRQLFAEIEEIENEQQLIHRMYQIAIQRTDGQLSDLNEFLFEEDHLLHQKIIELPQQDKFVLILLIFQKMDIDFTARLLRMTREEIQKRKLDVCRQFQDEQLKRRFNLLGKSYNRMTFEVDDKFEQLEELPAETKQENSLPQSKRGIAAVLSGVAVLVVLVIISIVNSESFKQASTEKWIERMKETYEEQRAAVFKELGLTEDDVSIAGGPTMGISSYLSMEEKHHFDRFIKGIERDIEKERELNKDKINEQFDAFIEELKTPSAMIEEVFKRPITNDLEASERFLEQYIAKQYILSTIYFNSFYEEPEVAEALFGYDEPHDAEQVMKNIEKLPKEIQNIIQKMEAQQIYFDFGVDELDDQQNEFREKVGLVLHPSTAGYLTLIGVSPYSLYAGQILEPDRSMDYLREVEDTLQATSLNHDIRSILEYRYAWALLVLLNGMEDGIYGDDGRVRKDVRQAWQKNIAAGENTVAAFIIERAMEEFESTNWQLSETQVFLTEQEILEILIYAKDQDIQTYEFDKINHLSYVNINLPNEGFNYMVTAAYEEFKQDYDISTLKDVHPLTILGLFFYANDLEDAETLWHLYHKDAKPGSLEKYIANWEQEEFLLSKIDHLHFSLQDRNGSFFVNDSYGDAQLMMNDDSWLIESINMH